MEKPCAPTSGCSSTTLVVTHKVPVASFIAIIRRLFTPTLSRQMTTHVSYLQGVLFTRVKPKPSTLSPMLSTPTNQQPGENTSEPATLTSTSPVQLWIHEQIPQEFIHDRRSSSPRPQAIPHLAQYLLHINENSATRFVMPYAFGLCFLPISYCSLKKKKLLPPAPHQAQPNVQRGRRNNGIRYRQHWGNPWSPRLKGRRRVDRIFKLVTYTWITIQ